MRGEAVLAAWGTLARHPLDRFPTRGTTEPLGLSDCEAATAGLLAQPVAAWTSLAFVGAAGWVIGRLRGQPPHYRPAGWAYGALLASVGIGSVAYHGPQLPGSALLHDGSVLLIVVTSVAVPALRRLRRRPVLAPGGGRYARVAAAALGCGVAAYLLGRTESPLCRPDSLVQLHGLWHILTALSAGSWAAALWAARST